MKQSQFNFLNMLSVVLNGMNNERSVWENQAVIASQYAALETEFNRVNDLDRNISATDTTGLTAVKDNTFDQLMNATHKMAKKMSAWAKKNNRLELLPLADISYTSLARGPEPAVVNRSTGIADIAEEFIDSLVEFGVTAEEITGIRQMADNVRKQAAERTTVSKDKSEMFAEIDNGIQNLRSELDVMDDLVKGLIDDREFINRYKSWRSIIDYGKGKTLRNQPEDLEQAS